MNQLKIEKKMNKESMLIVIIIKCIKVVFDPGSLEII